MAIEEVHCRYHPDRIAVGMCPSCSVIVCEECSARVEGILHCRQCLSERTVEARSGTWRSLSAVLPSAILVPISYLIVGYGLYGIAVLIASVSRLREWLEGLLQ